MNRYQLLAGFCVCFMGITSLHAQPSNQETFLRIANLLPISTKPVDLYRGATPYMMGLNSGFFQDYLPIPSQGGTRFTWKQGGVVIGEFSLPKTRGFYTAVTYQDAGSSPKSNFSSDEIKTESPSTDGEPPAPPKKHLRLFLGGYNFPVKLLAPPLGQWTTNGKALIQDIEISGPPPTYVQAEFIDKYNEKIELTYPTDFKASESYSVFVSQRGNKRLRLGASADNLNPAEDPLAATQAPPSPSPSSIAH